MTILAISTRSFCGVSVCYKNIMSLLEFCVQCMCAVSLIFYAKL